MVAVDWDVDADTEVGSFDTTLTTMRDDDVT